MRGEEARRAIRPWWDLPEYGDAGGMTSYDDYLRWLYRDGHPNLWARVQNRVSAIVFSAGIWPRRVATLEVRGRRSGRLLSFPVVIAELDGERYLVSMLGERAEWPRNVRAAGGQAFLRHGRREAVTLVSIDPASRAPILRQYVAVAPGARPHIPVDRLADLDEFERVAADFPVFRVTPSSNDPVPTP